MSVHVGEQLLAFEPPETAEFQALTKEKQLPDAPKDYHEDYAQEEVWPGSLRLTPLYDPNGTHILGHFFRAFQEETLTVSSADGSTRYSPGVDYLFHAGRGVIANVQGRLRGKIVAKVRAALQRIDLIQLDAAGNPVIKRGKSAWVCPVLPQADAGYTPLAGIYIAPWRAARNPHFDTDAQAVSGASEYAITQHEIFPIEPAPPVAPIGVEHLSGTLAKLRAGEQVRIAFLGDSITLGAEATRWWSDAYNAESTTYRGRFIYALRQRFPQAQIEVIEAYKGGVTIGYGLVQLEKIAAQKPDLVIAAFGANDVDGLVGMPPKTSAKEFGAAIGTITKRTAEWGGETLVVTTFPLHPWLLNGAAQRQEGHHAAAMNAAREHGAAVVDVYTEFRNLNTHGIPYWSQNHNWVNHPGDFGHALYAETILRAFPE